MCFDDSCGGRTGVQCQQIEIDMDSLIIKFAQALDKDIGIHGSCGSDECNTVPTVNGNLLREAVAECVGTMLLVAVIIGSGIMGAGLSSSNEGIALLANTFATWGILVVLITVFGPVSGAHFNPVVSILFFLKKELDKARLLLYISCQVVGAILGELLAAANFGQPAARFDGADRVSAQNFIGEITATFCLLMTITGSLAAGEKAKATLPLNIGLYIVAGYWFTSSTAFANPAVTIGRCFCNTFASINPHSIGLFIGGQFLGLLLAVPFCEWMFARKTVKQALLTLLRASISQQTSVRKETPIARVIAAATKTAARRS